MTQRDERQDITDQVTEQSCRWRQSLRLYCQDIVDCAVR
jgi:hypothetical protein